MLLAMIGLLACVPVQEDSVVYAEFVGDMLGDLPLVEGVVAKDFYVAGILWANEDSPMPSSALVMSRDRQNGIELFIGSELPLSSGKVATLRGLQRRAAYFEIDGRREVLIMTAFKPTLTPVGS